MAEIVIRDGSWSRKDLEIYDFEDLLDEYESLYVSKINEDRLHKAQEQQRNPHPHPHK